MKLSTLYQDLKSSHPKSLKIIQKGAFCIFINSEGFAISKRYNLKLTKLDRDSIKAGVPITALDKWLNIFNNTLLLKEFFRMFYNIGKIKGDIFYLDIGERFVEILKICKSIKEKI